MAKYINADEFVTNLDTIGYPVGEFATDDYIDGFSDGISDVMKEVMAMPSADVVEVVRCKDCKFRGREDCAMHYRCNCGEQHTWETDNDFCSYGEKKGD